MWTKKDEDRNSQNLRPTPQPARPVEAPRASAPSAPVTSYAPAANVAAGTAVIGPSVIIRGDVIAQEDLYINGNIEGTLQLEQYKLAVGPRGKVKAHIVAREVMIQGSVDGDIKATDKIIIKNEGTLVGDIQVAGIVIEDGAYFKGSIDIVRPAQAQAQAPKAPEAKVVTAT